MIGRTRISIQGSIVLLAVLSRVDASEMTQIMQDELQRSMQLLAKESAPPYFLSYEIVDQEEISIAASAGALVVDNRSVNRLLDVDLRVGNHELDNTRQILAGSQASAQQEGPRITRVNVPLETDALAIKTALWRETDNQYRLAQAQLTRIKANQRVSVADGDTSHDFSRETAQQYSGTSSAIVLDRAAWGQKLRKLSAPFAQQEFVQGGAVTLRATRHLRWLVNSEGAAIEDSALRYELTISASTRADDGMQLPRAQTFFAASTEQFPSAEILASAVAQMIDELSALRAAPLVEPYAGPAIFSGRASGVFFHEVLGHRVEGQRLKSVRDGQTFKDKLNTRILPESVSIAADPTVRQVAGIGLNGYYLYDNEGVAAQRVPIVEAGVLKNFLMSRVPIAGFEHSNGHGRRQTGYTTEARQSNLIVSTNKPVARAELKKQLLQLVRAQGKAYGLLFDDIQGGFTLTGRGSPNAFNVMPRMVYKIFPDGHEQLVRGVDLIGTPLTALSKIVAMDNEPAVFNGICGANSGNVPVSAVAPGMLISQIEVQRANTSQQRLPLLANPVTAKAKE